jgi:hypothetical protein
MAGSTTAAAVCRVTKGGSASPTAAEPTIQETAP